MVDVKVRILKLLKNKNEEITTLQIASELKIDRHTAAKHLEAMKSADLVDFRSIGKSKIWKINKAPFINALKNDSNISKNLKQILGSMDDQVSIQNPDFSIVWKNKGKVGTHKCYEEYAANKNKCKNCPVEKTFMTGNPESAVMDWKNKRIRIITQPIKNEDDETVAVVEIVKRM